mmetsp:Transcript_33757/g.63112  ORF Transcript_33757/g.63112 Transcript_33757/m.63112 type:complete len:382 (+) Transcript_33757:58-1203(+)
MSAQGAQDMSPGKSQRGVARLVKILLLLVARSQAEYDAFAALQLTQSALDEQMLVSVELANVTMNVSHPQGEKMPVILADAGVNSSRPHPEKELEIEEGTEADDEWRRRSTKQKIHDLIARFVYSKPPAYNKRVSKSKPLIFMHQAKSGGTSLRETLYKSSRYHGLSAFIPCNGGVRCQKFDIDGETAAVYGGHFCWKATMNKLESRRVSQVSCVTIFREPVSRILSCYYYRMVGQNKKAPTCLTSLSPERLQRELLENSCVNEPFRRIGDCNVATRLENHKSAEAQISAWETTLQHLSQCVPIILEEPASYQVAAHLFPQFHESFTSLSNVKLNRNKKYNNHCRVGAAHMRAVKTIANHEIRLYKAARKRMWRLRADLML